MFNYLKFLVVLAVTGEHGLKNNIIKKERKDIHDGSALTHRIMKTNIKPSLGV